MAKQTKTGKTKLGILIFLIIAVVLAVGIVGQQTDWFNKAAGPSERALTNLNTVSEIISTNNPDGTMGPQSSNGNWSNSLPGFLKGELVFGITDPQPSQLPTQAQGKAKGQGQKNGPQTITALNLTITKVEVHIAYQGKPGDKNKDEPVDHWETLNITTPIIVDLVQLAKTNDVSVLGITTLAVGKYTEVRLYLTKATATLEDGAQVDLTILGKDNIVRVVRPFTVVAGQTTKLTMDFDAQHSVVKAGDTYLLKPVIARLLKDH